MAILLSFLGVEILIFLLVLPHHIALKIHFSLDRNKCLIVLKLWGVKIVKIILEKQKDRFRMLINDKIIKRNTERKAREVASKFNGIDSSVLSLVSEVKVAGLIGGNDALNAGCVFGLFASLTSNIPKVNLEYVYPRFDKDCFVLEADLKIKLSILDVVEMVAVYGNKRNIETNH
jgi:hypothetical protein